MNSRVHLRISGRVQGVGFRANAQKTAQRLGIRGYARNLPDGRVEIVAEGAAARLNQFTTWCRTGPTLSRVTAIQIVESTATNEFEQFEIR